MERKGETFMSFADDLKAAKALAGKAPAVEGWCRHFAMQVTERQACPSREGDTCDVGCMDWRNERPLDDAEAELLKAGLDLCDALNAAKEELIASVDEQIAEMAPERTAPNFPPLTEWTPFAGMTTSAITLYYYSDAPKVAAPPEDPAMDALMRLADTVHGDYADSDFVTVAYELGLARGRAEVSD
jgi:hypothetical protein